MSTKAVSMKRSDFLNFRAFSTLVSKGKLLSISDRPRKGRFVQKSPFLYRASQRKWVFGLKAPFALTPKPLFPILGILTTVGDQQIRKSKARAMSLAD